MQANCECASILQNMVISTRTIYFHVRKIYFFHVKYCNGFDQRVVRQELCKHGPTRNNTGGCLFYVVRARANAANGPMNSHSDT
jgi:hypothetical protein